MKKQHVILSVNEGSHLNEILRSDRVGPQNDKRFLSIATRIALIGMGNMGTALVEGWVRSGVVAERNLIKVTRNDDLRVIEKAEQIWVCVKPVQLIEVLQNIKNIIDEHQLLISIAAGIKIRTIKKYLGKPKQPVVRVMPNTPLLVSKGMSGWVASSEVSVTQKNQVRKLLGAVGVEMQLRREQQLDVVTAISGSGPAYFFAMVEALAGAARKLGLPEREALILVYQTFFGAAALMQETGRSAKDLREAVASKGGTTEAALKVLKKKNFDNIWVPAVKAAHDRAMELGKS